MQNKYKLPDHVKGLALAVIKSYEAYKREIQTAENEQVKNSCKRQCVEAVEKSFVELSFGGDPLTAYKIKQALYSSCQKGRYFNFDYAGIDTISKTTFYRIRNRLLYLIAQKMEFL